jgi:GntR family transcriptional repressor for pyruvate dehydrogenase complex
MMKINQPEQFTNVLEIREMLEPEIAAKAASRATEEQIEALREALVRMEAHFEDVNAYIAIDHEFHLILAQATQNTLTSIIIESIVEFLHEQRRAINSLATLNEAAKNTTLRVHRQILEAIIRRNPEAAREAMNEHMLYVRERSQTIFDLKD